MRKVASAKFYETLGHLDVQPLIEPGPWPYVGIWRLRNNPHGPALGKSICRTTPDNDGSLHDYYLPDDSSLTTKGNHHV